MAFAEVVDGIYRAGVDRSRWQVALDLVTRHCAARSALLMVRDNDSGRIQFAVEHGLSRPYRTAYLQRFRGDDLRLQDLLRHPVGSIRTDTMIADYDAYERSAAYRHLYSRLGTEHALGGFLLDDGARTFAVRVFRSRAEGAFSRGEIERFRRLAPYLEHALALARRASRTDAVSRVLEFLVQSSCAPGCILETDGTLLAASGDGGQVLQHEAPAIHAGLARLLAAGRSDRASGPPAQSLSLADGRTAVLLLVDAHAEHRLPGVDAPLVLLVVHGERSAEAQAGIAARRYGLTAAEARLVQALLAGGTLSEAARRIGIGRETAKTQLRSAFQKVNVNRQADLLRRVLRCEEH